MAQSTTYSRVLGTGSYLPPNRVSNQELADRLAKQGVETSDEWIVARTGIHARHFAEPDVTTSDLALFASQRAIEAADVDPHSIDLIIVATSTPDFVFPSPACLLPNKLGLMIAALLGVAAGFVTESLYPPVGVPSKSEDREIVRQL